jgi:hypothetical protein
VATRDFHAGLHLARQLEYALFDFRLHHDYDPALGARALELLDEVRREVSVVPIPSWQRMPWSFGHIFGGGYDAGYYSYLWAEVLSADAFERFREAGIFDRDTGARSGARCSRPAARARRCSRSSRSAGASRIRPRCCAATDSRRSVRAARRLPPAERHATHATLLPPEHRNP